MQSIFKPVYKEEFGDRCGIILGNLMDMSRLKIANIGWPSAWIFRGLFSILNICHQSSKSFILSFIFNLILQKCPLNLVFREPHFIAAQSRLMKSKFYLWHGMAFKTVPSTSTFLSIIFMMLPNQSDCVHLLVKNIMKEQKHNNISQKIKLYQF